MVPPLLSRPLAPPRTASPTSLLLWLLAAAIAPLLLVAAGSRTGGLLSEDPVASIYWVSTPVLPGDTAVVAGAGLAGANVSLAGAGTACAAAAAAVTPSTTAWAQSVKAVLPVGCGPPCNITIETAAAQRVVVVINQPKVAWLHTDHNGAGPGARGATTVSNGGVLRVFGRGLAWELSETRGVAAWHCISGRKVLAAPSTRLVIHPPTSGGAAVEVEAATANCFEATFTVPAGLAVGPRVAELVTPWGKARVMLKIALPPASETVHISVDSDHGGDILAALHAAENVTSARAAPPTTAVVHLGAREYTLSRNLTLPNHTTLLGMGVGVTTLLFDLIGPAGHDWAQHPYGTGPHPTEGTFNYLQLAAVSSASIDSAIRDLSLVLRSPPWFPTAALWMPPGASNFSAVGLRITLEGANISNALRAEGDGFELGHTEITQAGSCTLGLVYGPGGKTTPGAKFMQRVLIFLRAATNGWIHDNNITWHCGGWMDGDTSDRVVIEDNRMTCTSSGDNSTKGIDGGNSISAYDTARHGSSAFWSIARNSFERPPHNGEASSPKPNPDWQNHETITTDSPGEFAHGRFLQQVGHTVTMNWTSVRPYVMNNRGLIGCAMVVLSGPGVGQHRTVAAFDNSTGEGIITLSLPFDNALNASSVVAIVPSIGMKNVVGNRFSWSGVLQFYGTTLGGVIADNTLSNVDVHSPYDSVNGASLRASGLCYYGAQPVFFVEILGNTLTDSDGVGFFNEAEKEYQPMNAMCNIDYGGAGGTVSWVRWGVARHNTISGISDAARYRNATMPQCGGVKVNSDRAQTDPNVWPTDMVAEHNTLVCPPPGVLPGTNGTLVLGGCKHCSIA